MNRITYNMNYNMKSEAVAVWDHKGKQAGTNLQKAPIDV